MVFVPSAIELFDIQHFFYSKQESKHGKVFYGRMAGRHSNYLSSRWPEFYGVFLIDRGQGSMDQIVRLW